MFPAEAIDPSGGNACFCCLGVLGLVRNGRALFGRRVLVGMVASHTIANVF